MTRFPHEPDQDFDDDQGHLPAPLERLGQELARVAAQRAVSRPWWRRLGSAWLLGLVAAVGASAVAVAAVTGVFGSPVSDPPGTPRPQPTVGPGVPRAGSQALTALRVADPAGGPPWGLRLTKTTRQQGCVQVGRVMEGQLGVLGQDGQFGDDGRFHPLPLGVQDQQNCTPLDGAGHAFVAVNFRGLPASGRAAGCRGPDQPLFRSAPGSTARPPRLPECPRADERIVLYGALGPEAVAVRYLDAQGQEQQAATSGPDGAYLVVLRPRPDQEVKGIFVPSDSPSSGLTAVQYRDGTTCRIPNARRLGGGRACPKRGYVQPKTGKVPATTVYTPVQAIFEPRLRRPAAPASPRRPGSQLPLQRVLHLRFTARIAARGQATYEYDYKQHGPRSEPYCLGGGGGSVGRDVSAGEKVDLELYLPPQCGRLTGQVRYRANEPAMGTGNIRGGVLVGRFSAQP